MFSYIIIIIIIIIILLAMLGWWGLGTGVTPHNSYGKKKFKYNWYIVYGTN